MAELTITDDFNKLTKKLNNFQRKQIPFFMQQSLNKLAFGSSDTIKKAMVINFDRPRPNTIKSVKYKKANKTNLTSIVYIDPERYEAFLKWQIKGGVNHPQGGTALPVLIKLNKYGNIVGRRRGILRGHPNRYIARRKTKSGEILGIYQRFKRQPPKLLAVIHKRVSYDIKLPFTPIVTRYYNRHSKKVMRAELKHALDTALPPRE